MVPRKCLPALLALVLALAFSACAAAPQPLPQPVPAAGGSPLRLVVATDLHFLPRSLVRDGAAFTDAYAAGDGKQINYIPELTDALVAELLADPPAALLLTGDLTLNGEREGHRELARRLLPLRQAGIPVLVIPGNHDIGNAFATGFNRDKTYSVRGVTAEEFAEIYREMGYGQAISRDNASLSYVCPLSEDLWAVMLDTNKYDRAGGLSIPDNSGALSSQTLAWLEDQLEEARRQGKEVISATHHNLLDQSPRLSTGYTLDNAGEVLELYGRYGVRVNFSGHVHIQNIRETRLGGKSFYDIATSSYAVYTNQYGVVDYRPGESLGYHTQEVDMEGWAAATGSQDPQLLGFEDYSYQFFYDLSYDRSYASLYMAQLNKDADLELMAQTMAILNPAYFSGYAAQLREEVKASDHYTMWRKHSGFAPIGYINSMLEEQDQDPRQVVVELN